MTNTKSQLIIGGADISESDLREKYPEVLATLLRDHTTGGKIFWATDNYSELGEAYNFNAPIEPSLITGKYSKIIRPRVMKDKELQLSRIRNMAEVFTPSWVCNAQNNLIDEAWFNRKNVFNIEHGKTWETIKTKILFPEEKSWKDYIRDNRLEITCGEAPYLTSRYDTTTGEFIPVESRIGLLDRKLRVINENVDQSGEWLEAAQTAYKSIYGYEWQGDSLLLAREALLYTFIENYYLKFSKIPQEKSIKYIAYIISWNIWQMDGLRGVIPGSCHEEKSEDFFEETTKPCPACAGCKNARHNGIYALIKDWSTNKKIEFVSLIRGRRL